MAKPGKSLLENAKREIEQLSKTSPTAAGQNRQNPVDEERVDTINQVFSLFRINFHNQFYAAYVDSETLNQAKRLWLNSLEPYSNSTILQAAKKVIEQMDYLPTLHRFMEACDKLEFALPPARDAYLEACRAGGPQQAVTDWSHPLVYLAARSTGWHTLRSQPENRALPIFTAHFSQLARDLREGTQFSLPDFGKNTEHGSTETAVKLSLDDRKKRLQALKDDLALDEAGP